MQFEVQGSICGLEMPADWEYYLEGLLVLPDASAASITGEMSDQYGTPIDVIVQRFECCDGYATRFKKYANKGCRDYETFGVFRSKEAAIYVGRLILTCNRAYHYNWKGITSIIMYGSRFTLDMATAVALLHKVLPKTKTVEILFNPPKNATDIVLHPVVLTEKMSIPPTDDGATPTKGLEFVARSYTRLFLRSYISYIPGVSFFNEDAFMTEVMNFTNCAYPSDTTWEPKNFHEIVAKAEARLDSIFKKYENGKIPKNYLG